MPRSRAGAVVLEKKLLNDFSGGLNDTNVAPLIRDNEAQTATNVFVNLRGGVEKRYGYTSDTGPVSQVATNFARLLDFSPQSITPGDTILAALNNDVYLPNITGFQTGGVNYFVTYANGTATFTNGSKTVSLATGTAEWLTQIMPNDLITSAFTQGSPSTWYTVATQTDNSTIQLTANFTGTTGTYTYAVRQRVLSYPVKGVMYNGSLFYGCGIGTNGGTTSSPGTIIYYNGTNTKRTYFSTGNVIPGVFASYKNYLFTADINYSKNSRLFWSALLDATSSTGWPSSNFVDVSPNDGQSIRGLIVHNDVLYIFKDHSIYYLNGNVFDPNNPTYSLNKVINPYNIGTYHGDSIRVFQNKIYFLGPDGIYALDAFSGLQNVSETKIRTTIRSLNNPVLPVNLSGNNPEATAIVYDNRYWLSVQTNATAIFTNNVNDITLCIEPNGAITRHSFAVQNFILATAALKYAMLGIEAGTWNTLQFDGTASKDGSNATASTFTTKVFGFNDFSKTTRVLDVFVAYYNALNQSATLSVFDDQGQVGSSASWSFPAPPGQANFLIKDSGSSGNICKITVSLDSASGNWVPSFSTTTTTTSNKAFYMVDSGGSGRKVRMQMTFDSASGNWTPQFTTITAQASTDTDQSIGPNGLLFTDTGGTINSCLLQALYDSASGDWTYNMTTLGAPAITVQRFEVNRDTNGLYLTISDSTSGNNFRVMGVIIVTEKDMMGSGVVVAQ